MFHPDTDDILAFTDVGRHIHRETGVAVSMLAEVMTVDENLRMLVNALKQNICLLGRFFRCQNEMLAVPCRAARKIARSAGMFPVKRKRHSPVMRKRHTLPGTVVPSHEVRSGLIPIMKEPAKIKTFTHSFIPLQVPGSARSEWFETGFMTSA